MLKGLLHILAWALLALYMVVTMGAVNAKMDHRVAKGVVVEIVNEDASEFIDREDIYKILKQQGWLFEGTSMDSISTEKMEARLSEFPWLENAECYKTVDDKIKINVSQRKPLVRVMAGHQNYYMDDSGHQMPPGIFTAAHVPVVTGVEPDSLLRNDVLNIIRFINEDEFLKAQIQQLNINRDREFVMIPRAGKQEIWFGEASDIATKFYKLKKLYKEEFGENGWNRYRVIDLRFDNQVVCTKK